MTIIVFGGYFGILLVLCVFGAHRLIITRLYHKNRNRRHRPETRFSELPSITIQLPIFNEKFVVDRMIDACVAIDYPRDRLQIQVVDDSTDETRYLAEARVRMHRENGIDIQHIHRENRVGFKAGALENAMNRATGEFIAIFDADFIPPKDILHRTIHHFSDPKIGMVQTRWDHLNRDFSTLTQVQSIMLDAHFMIEHGGRNVSGLFFNFNGTAGIWRRTAIEDAGGWEHDTLTEDLDLSYRAQMKGWRFLFIPEVTCPAELPIAAGAFKTQQFRWAKGSVQVMRKILPTIWRSSQPLAVKMEATFHLTGNLAYVLMMINTLIFVIPSMVLRGHWEWWRILLIDGPIFFMASISFILFYMASQRAVFGHTKGRKRFIPALMSIGIGLGLNNTRAVIEALMGKQSEFVRTPKTGSIGKAGTGGKTGYKLPRSGWGLIEVAIGFMYTGAIVWAIQAGVWGSVPFLLLFQNGFLYMGLLTLFEEWHRGRPQVVRNGEEAGNRTVDQEKMRAEQEQGIAYQEQG
ncbi:cellulose synthase family protein [Sulfidibacter corallicola]|uniref:Glycosyltransferase n=1 Tax=Sulfidibacter corallicola TaxID=2818388 RepID=A0A8A4TXM5_SULCO|nr:cellulose synthase family protein [Sulfidibacter corallicola]QTD53961.1 glycosyltransferase [Sulfidibacter corallicola]